MDPFAAVSAFADNLARRFVAFALLVAAIVGGYLYLTRDPGPVERLQRTNPGWTVATADGLPVRVDDASGRGEVLLSHDDLGPYRMERVDCDAVKKLFPEWFSLPDVPIGNCLRLHDGERQTWVLNVRTPLPVTQIWDRHYEPVLDRLKLPYSGGRSGRFPEGAETDLPAGQQPPEEKGSGSYSVYARDGGAEWTVLIAFYRRAGTTELIFRFRPAPPT